VGSWRRLNDEELRNLYASLSIIGMIMWTGYVARTEEMRNVYKVLVGKPKAERPLGMSSRRWKVNNVMGLRELAQDMVSGGFG
jgi:hypothetical protein